VPHNELPGKVQIPKNFMSLRDKVLRKAAEMIAKVHGVRHICPNAFLCLPMRHVYPLAIRIPVVWMRVSPKVFKWQPYDVCLLFSFCGKTVSWRCL